jgi:hypothetical protein
MDLDRRWPFQRYVFLPIYFPLGPRDTRNGEGLLSRFDVEDVRSSQNQYWAYEDVQRAAMSKVYKEAATKFFLEAFYTFIDEEMEYKGRIMPQGFQEVRSTNLSQGKAKHLTSNQYIRDAWEDTDCMDAFSKIFTLWSTACKWSIHVGQDGAAVRGHRRARVFREMMRRAVHHYAHAEWLVQELYELQNGC